MLFEQTAKLKAVAISVMPPGSSAYPVLPAICVSGTKDSCFGRPPYPSAQRPSGGQKLVMASSPPRYDVKSATGSHFSAPGGMYCFASIICWSVLTAAGLLIHGFIVCPSKNSPPLTRNQHSNQLKSVPPAIRPVPNDCPLPRSVKNFAASR